MELVGYLGAVGPLVRHVTPDGGKDRLVLVHTTPGVLAHIDEVAHVVLRDARHREGMSLPRRVAYVVLVVEDYGVPRPDAMEAGQLLRHDHRVVVEGQLLLGQAVAEAQGPLYLLRVLGHHHADSGLFRGAGRGARAFRLHVVEVHPHQVRGLARGVQVVHDLAHVQLGGPVGQADGRVVVDDGPKLQVDDVPDGVMQTKAHQKEGRAARDADDGHEQAPLVAKEVAGRHLPGEGEAPPQGTDALQQDALASLWCAGQHEGCGGLPEARGDGRPGGQEGHAHTQSTSPQGDGQVEGQGQAPERHRVDDRVGRRDDQGQDLREDRDAKDRADSRGQQRIEEVAAGNAGLAVAQGFEGAYLHAVIVHQARHRGQGHQGRHQEEDKGKDVPYVVHALGVRLVGGGPLALGPVQGVDVRQVHVVYLPLGVLNLRPGVGKLLVGVGAIGLVAGPALVVVALGLVELVPRSL